MSCCTGRVRHTTGKGRAVSESIRLRKARAVYDHASRSYKRLIAAGPATDRQDGDDAWLAKELAALDLEAAEGQGEVAAALLKRADELLEEVTEYVAVGGEWQGKVSKWRSDLWAMALKRD